jgi:hypothetical protein
MHLIGLDKAPGAVLIHTAYKDYPRGFIEAIG